MNTKFPELYRKKDPVGVPDWHKAPSWAMYASISVIGSWKWWSRKPKWDFIYGQWEGEFLHTFMSIRSKNYGRRDRRKSLEKRPDNIPPNKGNKDHHLAIDTPLNWDKAPRWATHASINVIGGWEWWPKKPKWNFAFGQYESVDELNWEIAITSEPSLQHAIEYGRKHRKKSLHTRPQKG